MKQTALIADIGGTHARFALARGDSPYELVNVESEPGDDAELLLRGALDRCADERPRRCVLAVAGPVDGDHVSLTNRPMSFSRQALREALGFDELVVINDFAAQAHALPGLQENDLLQIGGGKAIAGAPMLVCGPGTGFGTGVLIMRGGVPFALSSEAGQMRLAAATANEARLLARLVRESGPVSIEQILSGPGLARAHRILTGEALSATDLVQAAQTGNAAARESLGIFLRLFGRIAGDLALAFDARGGVYLSGGLGRALAPLYPRSDFRAAFEEHPPYGARLATVPTQVVLYNEPGLLGAAKIARDRWGAP